MKLFSFIATVTALFFTLTGAGRASDNGVPLDHSKYANRQVLKDFTAAPCPDNPRGLTQIKGNLYRHTTGPGLAVHSGLVLITKEGALVIDPAMTCTATWLRDEIKSRFNVKVKYVVYTHGHADHISGAQVFQQDGAIVVANQRAVEPIVGERIPTAIPDRVFDEDMTITLGGEKVLLHRVAPSHSDSMTMILFPKYKALQCTDVCESKSMPYNDFLDFYYDGWIESLNWVLAQDVDVIDVGHYTPATKDDERALRDYMIDLHQQILDLVRNGQSWDELYRNVHFSDEVKKWIAYDQMHVLNIMGMYRWVSNHRRGEW
ncbi:Glyoxylase, beta-lactamase superfamily II [Collimonas sp. OK607]|uniref:MBL fold metallo-hydrolase n=1 Tax=Collimonas sp. OK607 TaxID=1798194 RepID=UPI0008EEAC02|nr:MBL fold metallo-hydrolase [Collimonas sp. OK607]SFA75791.1 Glyoxylase, beta-lactamase superfamily II [Collimonas sp. OK607]